MSKDTLITALISQTDAQVKPPPTTPPPLNASWDLAHVEKPALKPGITLGDVFQHYSAAELRSFLSESEASTAGKAKELAKRTLQVLDGTYTATPKKPKKRRPDALDTRTAKPKKRKLSDSHPRTATDGEAKGLGPEGAEAEAEEATNTQAMVLDPTQPKPKPKAEQPKRLPFKTRSVVAKEREDILISIATSL